MELLKDIKQYINKEYLAIGLFGSYSRNEQTEFSDIDIYVLTKDYNNMETYFINGKYTTISYESLDKINIYFTSPIKYLAAYSGFKHMVILEDKENNLSNIINKILNIDYFKDLDKYIIEYINKETHEWFEEVLKAINGYHYDNEAKMLLGLHGLTYGMLNVLKVYLGLKAITENNFLSILEDYFKNNEYFINLVKSAFGLNQETIKERVIKGLELYIEIIKIIEDKFNEKLQTDILYIVKEIYPIIQK